MAPDLRAKLPEGMLEQRWKPAGTLARFPRNRDAPEIVRAETAARLVACVHISDLMIQATLPAA